MDNITDINQSSQSAGFKKPQRFRIAYSINNYQPVKSTYIAEEPLFYIDEEGSLDDEMLMDDGMFDMIEEELKTLERDLNSIKRNEGRNKKEENFLEFLADGSFLDEQAAPLDRDAIQARITDTLSKSRMAKTLLAFANKNNIDLKITDQTMSVVYDKKAKAVFVRDDLDFSDQIFLTIEALRQVWQDCHKATKHPLTFHPDHAVLAGRAQAADLKVCLIRCLWELKLAGETQFWDKAESSTLYDLARSFAREALMDFRSLDSGKAHSAVFEAWFLSTRCNHQDGVLIQSMLAENNNFVFDSSAASYKNLTLLISALGEQPHGKNYLARFTDLIMNDPLFTDVRDRSNANFLWFVKFERAYNEAEQDLQSNVVTTLPGIEPVQKNNNKDTGYDTQQQGEALFQQGFRPTFGENFSERRQINGDNVVVVDFIGNSIDKEERIF